MKTFVLDAGALIAIDRGDREVLATLQTAFRKGDQVRAPAGVIGQTWRNPDRQVLLARTLKRCDEAPLDGSTARAAGKLCGETGTSDVIDASVAIAVVESELQDHEVVVLTSDTADLRLLLAAVGAGALLVDV